MTDTNIQPNSQRKFKLAIVCLTLITLGFIFAAFVPNLAELYVTYISGIIGLNLAYYGANVSHKWVLGKSGLSVNTNKKSQAVPGV